MLSVFSCPVPLPFRYHIGFIQYRRCSAIRSGAPGQFNNNIYLLMYFFPF